MIKTVKSVYIAHEEENGETQIHTQFDGEITSLQAIILMALAIDNILRKDAENHDQFMDMKREAQDVIGMNHIELNAYYTYADFMGGKSDD